MKTSQTGINLIKKFESLSLTSYICPSGKLTIGWGHTQNVKLNQTITEIEAENLLKKDLSSFENTVNYTCKYVNQNQFDALVSFCFNCGSGAFIKSALLKLIQEDPNNPLIRDEFMKYVNSNGKTLPGLVRRRKAEADLYFKF
jgi:lysozyme